jgi:hypothetical protein
MVKREDVISIVFVPHKMAKQSRLTVAVLTVMLAGVWLMKSLSRELLTP